ncbi:unnamed protein product [Caretta caretta]
MDPYVDATLQKERGSFAEQSHSHPASPSCPFPTSELVQALHACPPWCGAGDRKLPGKSSNKVPLGTVTGSLFASSPGPGLLYSSSLEVMLQIRVL